MIKKIIIISLLLFLAYNAFLAWAKPATGDGQHQWQQNRVQAEEYVYEHQGVNNVIVGSSLSFRMKSEFLPDSVYNLSFGGGSIFTGLDLIMKCEKKPEVVFIEANIADRPGDPTMAKAIFRPVIYPLRKVLPALKEKYQPVNLLTPLLKKMTSRQSSSKKEVPVASTVDTAIYNKIIIKQLEVHSKAPEADELKAQLDKLKEYVKTLQAQGITIVFFSMPVDPQLKSTPTLSTVLKAVKTTFPTSEYNWLPEPDDNAYGFTDGLHMDFWSARSFTERFLRVSAPYLK